jgi:hypothetical protein
MASEPNWFAHAEAQSSKGSRGAVHQISRQDSSAANASTCASYDRIATGELHDVAS